MVGAEPVAYDHVEGGGGGAFFDEAADVKAFRVGTAIDDLVDRALVAVESEHDGSVLRLSSFPRSAVLLRHLVACATML